MAPARLHPIVFANAAVGAQTQIDAPDPGAAAGPLLPRAQGPGAAGGGGSPRKAKIAPPCGVAASLAPRPALIQIMLAQALLATNDKAQGGRKAVRLLENRLADRGPSPPDALHADRDGPMAARATSRTPISHPPQARSMRGDMLTARQLADRRQDPLSGRFAGLGQGRRHIQL